MGESDASDSGCQLAEAEAPQLDPLCSELESAWSLVQETEKFCPTPWEVFRKSSQQLQNLLIENQLTPAYPELLNKVLEDLDEFAITELRNEAEPEKKLTEQTG